MHRLDHLLGLHTGPADLTFVQLSARAFIVFAWGIVIVRCGDRRLLGRNAGFDMLLVVVLGSVLSRGINGQSAFFPTLGVCAVLVLLHHLLAVATLHSDRFSRIVKGTAQTLIKDGRADGEALRAGKITKEDLKENLRLNGAVSDVKAAREARLERNGSISVIPAE